MRRHEQKKPQLSRWILASLVAHVGVFLIYAFLNLNSWNWAADQQVIQMHIVQRGKKRDENLLPRIVPQEEHVEAQDKQKEPSPPQETKTQPVTEPQKHQIQPAKAPEKKKPPSSNINPLEALKRRVKELEKEGDPNASLHGNSVTGDLKDSYKSLVHSLLKENFDLPATLSDKERQSLRVVLNIKIAPDGKLISVKVISRSRNSDYDDAVLTRVNQITSFGAPPITLRREVQRQGLPIEMCPLKCP